MKKLVRSLVIAFGAAALVGGAAPLAAQRVAVDIHIGVPGVHYRQYRHGHRVYRHYHRPYARWYGRPVIVVGPRGHARGRPVVMHRPLRANRHLRWY
jgi:hypothetical protein